MENWLAENGKPAIFTSLRQAWDRLEAEFQDAYQIEIAKQNETNTALQMLRNKVKNIDRLEAENKTLKEELAYLKECQRRQRSPSKALPRTPLAPVSVNGIPQARTSSKKECRDIEKLSRLDLLAEHLKLEEKVHKLSGQLTDVLGANEQLRAQCREKGKAYEKWVQHAKTLEGQVQARNRKIDKLKARWAMGVSKDATPDPSHVPNLEPSEERGGDIQCNHLQAAPKESADASEPCLSVLESHERDISFSQDGLDEGAPSLPPLPKSRDKADIHHHIKQEPSSDTPIITSERVLRKRKPDNNESIERPSVSRVKIEHSSDPVVTDEQHHFIPHESIDFDNVDDMISTPRKLRNPPVLESTQMPLSIVDQLAGLLPAALEPGIPSRRSSLRLPEANSARPHLSRKRRSAGSTIRERIGVLTEDGDDEPSLSPRRPVPASNTGRLDALLNSTSSPLQIIAPHSGHRVKSSANSDASHIGMPQKRELPFGNKTQSVGMPSERVLKPTEKTFALKGSPFSASATEESPRNRTPLRARPVASLKQGDFKVNPKYNDGVSYAFNEVVRRKDERACLPGCTKEICCGKYFRPLAQAARETTGPIEFQTLLEEYLGENSWRLGPMTKNEKEKMWINAKIKELSNKHGRHRNRYDRMASPPGFWRADFPTTQEDLDDKEEAEQMQRDEIEEKYREAINKGRWLFRDEDP
ncbi:DNA repair protein endonuclease SAE2/CtIP C-terminus-domain-containing protein [Xylariales sp. PMI_506]|nr:DNA repair protein endonuclease SAE2/CtIP C-terminus-domain-containing protein [Xylariales sp. PMI_506]